MNMETSRLGFKQIDFLFFFYSKHVTVLNFHIIFSDIIESLLLATSSQKNSVCRCINAIIIP